jgi:hypothetical protein
MTTRDSSSYYSNNRKKSDLFTSWIAKQFGQLYSVSRKPDQTTKTKGIFWWVQKTSRGTFKRKWQRYYEYRPIHHNNLLQCFRQVTTDPLPNPQIRSIAWSVEQLMTITRGTIVRRRCSRNIRPTQVFCNILLSRYSIYTILL